MESPNPPESMKMLFFYIQASSLMLRNPMVRSMKILRCTKDLPYARILQQPEGFMHQRNLLLIAQIWRQVRGRENNAQCGKENFTQISEHELAQNTQNGDH